MLYLTGNVRHPKVRHIKCDADIVRIVLQEELSQLTGMVDDLVTFVRSFGYLPLLAIESSFSFCGSRAGPLFLHGSSRTVCRLSEGVHRSIYYREVVVRSCRSSLSAAISDI